MKHRGIFFAVVVSFLFSYCSGEKQSTLINSQQTLLKNNADEFIISKTGKDIFDECFVFFDDSTVAVGNGSYMLCYYFSVQEKPYIYERVTIVVDSSGNLIHPETISGIPDVLNNPDSFIFEIDGTTALAIAEKNKFEKGIKEWRIDFSWSPEYNQYIWEVLSVRNEGTGSNGYRGEGKRMIIHPKDGKILSVKDWFIR